MKFFYTLVIISLVPNVLYAMHHGSLNHLEKSLVLREIGFRGLNAIEKAVEDSSSPKNISDPSQQSTTRSHSEPSLHPSQPNVLRSSSAHNISRIKVPVILRIHATFCKTETNADPLTVAIFHKISSIESKNGYIPTEMETIDGHYCYTNQPTNYLGSCTRYYWQDGKDKNVVNIKSDITNKKDLQEIIKQNKVRLEEAINSKQVN